LPPAIRRYTIRSQRMKRLAPKLFAIIPVRNRIMASFAMTAATAAAAAALTPSTTFIRAKATDNNNGPRIIPRTKNEDHAAPRCVVSRNGIRVPWQTIHQKYIGSVSNCNGVDGGINKGIKDDIDGDYGDGNFDDDALAMDAITLLQLLPRGAYTTCRTVRGGTAYINSIIMFGGWL